MLALFRIVPMSEINYVFKLCLIKIFSLLLLCCMGCARHAPAVSPESGVSGIQEIARHSLSVHFIDVGQGSAVLVEAPEKTVLIDAGERGSPVPAYLRNRKIDTIDIVVGTHPHSDHIGGLVEVLRQFGVGEVIDPAVPHTTKTYEDYLNLIRDRDIRFTAGRAGLRYDLGGGVHMNVLHPVSPDARHLNDASIVVQVVFDKVSFLLPGDAERASEQEMTRRYSEALDSTVLLAGHHGSRTSSTPEFIARVRPEVAVIMCGKGNRYGHPHAETLKTFERFNVTVYRTDEMGTVVIYSDGRSYEVELKGSIASKIDVGSDQSQYPSATLKSSVARVDINSADYETLQEIVHVGPARASEIIRQRPFRSLEALRSIRGISSQRLHDIREEGKAYVQ
jgi:competence protein ComEC